MAGALEVIQEARDTCARMGDDITAAIALLDRLIAMPQVDPALLALVEQLSAWWVANQPPPDP